MKTFVMISVLIAVVIFAPLNRVLKSNYENKSALQSDESRIINNIPGLVDLGSIEAANTGPYKIRGFRHPTCLGSIAILPLYRNAEGSHILRKKINSEIPRYGFLINGKIYSSFPQFTFGIQKALNALVQLSHNNIKPSPPVLAFAEQGRCQLAEKIVKYTL